MLPFLAIAFMTRMTPSSSAPAANPAGIATREPIPAAALSLVWPLTAALVLRLLWAWSVPVEPVSDSGIYDEFARSLAAGRGYAYADGQLTAYWPVGTAALYGALYHVFGAGPVPIVVLNLLLGLLAVALTHALAQRYFDARTAAVAAWFVACWPLMIQFTTILASELLFLVLLMATLYAWGHRAIAPLPRAVLWGGFLCAAVYVRPTALPLFFILPLAQAWQERAWRDASMSAVVAAIVAAAMLAPWALRNQALFGTPVLVSTNFGPNLWMGNNPDSTGVYMDLPSDAPSHEVERDRHLKRAAVEFILDNPQRYLALSLKRLVATFGRESIGVTWNEPALRRSWGGGAIMPLKLLSSLYWAGLFTLALLGLGLALARGRIGVLHPLVLVGALFVAVPVLTVGQDRYHVPLNGILAIFASWAVVWLKDRYAVTSASSRPTP